jgi:hypothetical protein
MRYDAFMSYSHAADHVSAPALQRALHRFACPWNRMRALTVFRDQTSLAASPELWPAIEGALSNARWLIIMASPAAAASRWVAREIEWWLTHRSPQTILMVLTEGDLWWDQTAGDFDWVRTTCLPQEIVSGRFANEPLWIDLSWAKTADVLTLRHARFRQAVLDLAAPLHGRPKDELDGDDVRQFTRVQRLRNGAIAALVGLTTLVGAAAWIAVGQRNEARRQAAIAQAGRLSVQADQLRERGGPADASVMLAAEALRLLDGISERSADVDQSLRRALTALPQTIGSADPSGHKFRLTPDGARLLAAAALEETTAYAFPSGSPVGCRRADLQGVTRPGRMWDIQAVADDGAWCVVHVYFDDSKRHDLELWSAAPFRLITTVTLPSMAGHVRPAVAPGGQWLGATDVPQGGDTSGSVVRFWPIRDNGEAGAVQIFAGMEVVAFSPDGRHVATTAGLWRFPARAGGRTGAGVESMIPVVNWEKPASSIAFSPDSAFVATQAGFGDGVIVWDVLAGKEVHRASSPPGELMALGAGGTRLVVDASLTTVVWDAVLHVARATLPGGVEAAALPGNGSALFVIKHIDRLNLTSQRFVTLPEDPAAIRAAVVPAAAADVRRMQIAGGVATFVEHAAGGARQNGVSRTGDPGGTVRTLAWDLRDGAWSTRRQINKVAAFALAASGQSFAVAADGQVVVAASDAGTPEQRLAPAVALASLAFSGDDGYLLGYAPGTDPGGTLHVWRRRDGAHWAVAIEIAPSATAITRDGRFILAAGAHGEATRAGQQVQLWRWNLSVPGDRVAVTVGRSLREPTSICGLLGTGGDKEAASARVGVSASDLAECSSAIGPPQAWAASLSVERQLTVLAPSQAAVARIDHAAKVLLGAVSPDGMSAVTLDESGVVQLFPATAKALIAQACQRQPAPLRGALRALLPPESQAVDACGRREEKSDEDDGR